MRLRQRSFAWRTSSGAQGSPVKRSSGSAPSTSRTPSATCFAILLYAAVTAVERDVDRDAHRHPLPPVHSAPPITIRGRRRRLLPGAQVPDSSSPRAATAATAPPRRHARRRQPADDARGVLRQLERALRGARRSCAQLQRQVDGRQPARAIRQRRVIRLDCDRQLDQLLPDLIPRILKSRHDALPRPREQHSSACSTPRHRLAQWLVVAEHRRHRPAASRAPSQVPMDCASQASSRTASRVTW